MRSQGRERRLGDQNCARLMQHGAEDGLQDEYREALSHAASVAEPAQHDVGEDATQRTGRRSPRGRGGGLVQACLEERRDALAAGVAGCSSHTKSKEKSNMASEKGSREQRLDAAPHAQFAEDPEMERPV